MQQFFAYDKLGKEILVEFTRVDPQSPQFSEELNSISDMLSRAYVPVEVEFVRKFSSNLSKDKFLNSIEPFFKDGIDNVKWPQVEERVKQILIQFFGDDFSKSLAANKEMSTNFTHLLIVAKEQGTKSPIGAIYCLMNKVDPEKIVRIPVFGVSPKAQCQGIGKLLMNSILKCIPDAKKIALSTRVTNERAIKTYHAWGFVPSPNTMEHWLNLEYTVEFKNGLID